MAYIDDPPLACPKNAYGTQFSALKANACRANRLCGGARFCAKLPLNLAPLPECFFTPAERRIVTREAVKKAPLIERPPKIPDGKPGFFRFFGANSISMFTALKLTGWTLTDDYSFQNQNSPRIIIKSEGCMRENTSRLGGLPIRGGEHINRPFL